MRSEGIYVAGYATPYVLQWYDLGVLWPSLRTIHGAVPPLTPGHWHDNQPRSPSTDHGDNPLPTPDRRISSGT